MNRKYTNRKYLDALAQKVLVFDGAMGTSLQVQNLTAEHFGGEQYNGCNDFLVISYPEAVEKVHRSFLEVGVDVIETNTFRANRITMAEYELGERVIEINETAARLARRLADEYSQIANRQSQIQNRFVAGSIGPSGKLPSANDPDLSNVGFDELADVFREQAVGLIRGGVDLLLIETSQDILEVKAAIRGIHKAFDETQVYLPIQAQVTLDTTGRMLLGTDINAALAILEGMGIDVIGLNCSTGPEHMREPIRVLGENATLPVSCIPNAGLPLNVDGQAVYPLEPEPFANDMYEFVTKHKISIVGGCCGTTPEHLKLVVDKLNAHPHPDRPNRATPQLASAMSAIAMRQDPPPTLLGERCNAQGSRKFKRLLLEEDYDSILEIAREQVEYGAHALDISCAVTERPDEVELMRKVVKKLEMGVDVPLVIDTTELDVLEVALKTAPGRCLINSTHLESGREKADKIFKLAKEHNAAVIVLTIDEGGMAKTREKKLEVAKRIYDIAVDDHGLKPQDLVYDTLTFTLATGDEEFANSAIETIEGIRLIKQNLPGVMASLGVSNLSFGLAPHARPVLNSVMLYHCMQAGLDMAIVNPAHITAYPDIPQEEKDLAEDLIFNRRPDALQRYIEYYENVGATHESPAQANPTEGMTAEQRLHWKILRRHKDGVEADIDSLIPYPQTLEGARDKRQREENHTRAVNILNNVLLPAMKEVGDKFGAGELILPFVLQSAEVMKKTVAHLENYLEKVEGVTKGTVVIATVYGDVHDIGKNLVKTILANNGYTVVDLGKQVPAETIITKAVEVNATAIGLSALLVSTSKQMPLIVNELHRRGLKFPVLVGGAAINRRFGRRILFTEDGSVHEPGVFYCKDAFEGLETMDQLIVPERRAELLQRVRKEGDLEMGRTSQVPEHRKTATRSKVEPEPIQHPLKWGQRIIKDMPLEMVLKHLNLNELYRLSWGAKNSHGPEWEKLKKEFEARLKKMTKAAHKDGWLKPQAVYGYFPCQSEGDDLVIYDPATLDTASPDELRRFHFPRQPYDDHLALSDYFASVESGKIDVVALQVVTVGLEATERFDKMQAAGDYSEAYFTHGLAVQSAEATADYLHNHIRRELGIGEDQGKRYSWGYPAIPELEDHKKVFELLPAVETELGMTLSPAYQLIPEQSTAAIIVPHSQAKYYSVGESRVEQLMR
ncbi:MAG: methionine synthase [Anaerolineales bacterium]|nr:methionine synthase [Anaerolineales bacterium]